MNGYFTVPGCSTLRIFFILNPMNRLAWDSPWPDFSFYHLAQTGSTMTDARELSKTGSRNGCVLADYQSAGRGRLDGRIWHSDTATSLLATIWTETSDELASVAPLVTGAAVLYALQSLRDDDASRRTSMPMNQAELLIKWPNDILCNGQKLAGILCERSNSTILAGIGLNLSQTSFPGIYRTRPISFLQAFGFAPERRLLLERILDNLWNFYLKKDDWHAVISAHLAFKNEPVVFSVGMAGLEAETHTGIFRGLNREGAVLIQTQSGLKSFFSGEIKAGSPLTGS